MESNNVHYKINCTHHSPPSRFCSGGGGGGGGRRRREGGKRGRVCDRETHWQKGFSGT